jgi:hypothetical protein
MRKTRWLITVGAIVLAGVACTLPFGLSGGESPEAATPTPSPHETVEATQLAEQPGETLTPTGTSAFPAATPSLTPLPSPTPLGEEGGAGEAEVSTAQPTASTTEPPSTGTPLAGSPTPVPPDTLPIPGAFDVYLGAPDEDGRQLLRWVETTTGVKTTEITIKTDDGMALRAGQYVYFYEAGTRQPKRVNTAGAVETLTFARPPQDALYFEFLPSPTGQYLAWLSISRNGGSYTINQSAADGSTAGMVATGKLEPGKTMRLIRLTNDGSTIFYDLRPDVLPAETLFNSRTDLFLLDVATGVATQLPGEPACGADRVCDGHVSLDGSYLVRTIPPATAAAPIVVTNLTNGQVVARFVPLDVPPGAAFAGMGYPYFTPGGELIYTIAYGPSGLENYMIVWANLVTGEQRILAELGQYRHRPLGWAAEGAWLLTTREPASYETWQINVETGEMRRIAGMLFLGHIESPPPF